MNPDSWKGFFLVANLGLVAFAPLYAQAPEADQAWSRGHFGAARSLYEQVLAQNPRDPRANLRIGLILSRQGKLDSSLVFLARARASDPGDPEIRLSQARVMAWNKQYAAALIRYDSVLALQPDLREASLGRARTLAWSGRLKDARAVYRDLLSHDSTDLEATLGNAQISAWRGDLEGAERGYRKVLAGDSRNVEARVGLGYVYFWQDRPDAAERQARYALAIDSTHKEGRELRRQVLEATRPSVETSANWTNDSDDNTSFGQAAVTSATLGGGVGVFGSVNALEASDPVREATRVGGEAGLSLTRGPLQLSGAAGARRLTPEVAPSRTTGTYRGSLSYRPVPKIRVGLGYSRSPFDEIAALIEQSLDMELLEAGFDVKPVASLTMFAGAGGLWLSDGNNRTSFSAGLTQSIRQRFSIGLAGKTLSYERRGVGYFSPDRFSVLEATAGYNHQSRTWTGSLGGGLGAQQVGRGGTAQTEWHVEGRVGPRWGAGNRIELFGLVTNSAVSSTTGAFRYRSAGLTVRLGL